MASGLFALLDDIASLMDDVATATKVASQKTAGILGDDLAVNAEKSTGFVSSRELPVLWAITKGSFLNKVIIIPAAFVLNVYLPLAITIILMVGGAYLAHGVAAGIRGVPAGQWAAAMALGFTRWGALRHVVLPQALRMMLPSFINQWVTLVKDSSLAYIVGVPELSFLATQVNARVMVHPAEVFLCVGAVYWLLCSALDGVARRLARASA